MIGGLPGSIESAASLAATPIAEDSIKPSASKWPSSRRSTSLRTNSFPAQAWERNVLRLSSSISCAALKSLSISCQCSGFISSSVCQLTGQPNLCESPVTFHSVPRNLQHFRGLIQIQAAKEPQFNDPCLSGIELGKSIQSIIEFYQVRN